MPWWRVGKYNLDMGDVRVVAPRIKAIMITEQVGEDVALDKAVSELRAGKLSLDAAERAIGNGGGRQGRGR